MKGGCDTSHSTFKWKEIEADEDKIGEKGMNSIREEMALKGISITEQRRLTDKKRLEMIFGQVFSLWSWQRAR